MVRNIVKKVLNEGLPSYVCLNVNVPKEWNGEMKICRMAHGHWRQEVDARVHPGNGKPYYWMTGYYQNDEPLAEDTDAWAIAQGYAAITPLTVDHTADIDFTL
jgi:5'-nucleotidase